MIGMANLHGGPGDGQAFRSEIRDVLVFAEWPEEEYKAGEEISPMGPGPIQHIYHLRSRETVGRQAHYYWGGVNSRKSEGDG